MGNQLNSLVSLVQSYANPATQIAKNLSGQALDYCKIQNPIARGVVSGVAVYLGVAGAPTLPFSFVLVVCKTIKYHYDKAGLLEYSWSKAAKDLFLPVLFPPLLALRWMYGMQKTPPEQGPLEHLALQARTSMTQKDWSAVLNYLPLASPQDIATTQAAISTNRKDWDTLSDDPATTIQVLALLFPERLSDWMHCPMHVKKSEHKWQWFNLGDYSASTFKHDDTICFAFNNQAARDAKEFKTLQDNDPRKLAVKDRLIKLALSLKNLLGGFPTGLGNDLAHLRTAIEVVAQRRAAEDKIVTNALSPVADRSTVEQLGTIKEWKRIEHSRGPIQSNFNIIVDSKASETTLSKLLAKPGSES